MLIILYHKKRDWEHTRAEAAKKIFAPPPMKEGLPRAIRNARQPIVEGGNDFSKLMEALTPP